MKQKIILILLAMMPLALFAQSQKDAVKVLDKTAATLRNAGGLKMGYTLTTKGSINGTLKMKGNKFVNNMGSTIVWYNGRTMWTLIKENEEVNVTNPSAKEIAKVNPYAVLGLYKQGYNVKFTGKSNAQNYEILLTAKDARSSIKSILLRIGRHSYRPAFARVTGSDGSTMDITVTSFAKNQPFTDATFTFNSKSYPDYDVIDLR